MTKSLIVVSFLTNWLRRLEIHLIIETMELQITFKNSFTLYTLTSVC